MLTMEQAITMIESHKKSEYVLKHKMTPKRWGQLQDLKKLMEAYPIKRQKDWAEELGWSVQRVNRRKREIEELEAQGIDITKDYEV